MNFALIPDSISDGLVGEVGLARKRGLFGVVWMPPHVDQERRHQKMTDENTVGLTEGQIKSILDVRRRRAGIFGEGLFSDPAWDILLELLAARLGNRKVTLADLKEVAPKSVLARWIAELEERQLVICDVNPFRPDQFWLRLSDACTNRMIQFLTSARHLSKIDRT
jgi:hypothetical protein